MATKRFKEYEEKAQTENATTVELRAQVLRLRVALSQCKHIAERMRIWSGVQFYWGNPDAKAIAETASDALSEVE